MARVTKILRFEAAHRLLNYEGACANLHGHSYKVEITIHGPVGPDGFVIDFKNIKETVGAWLNSVFDHAVILELGDPILSAIQGMCLKTFVMEVRPTAEHMAQLILNNFDFIEKVVLWETETSYAEVSR